MFLNILKYKALKKSVLKQMSQGQEIDLKGDIKEVGVILDQGDFAQKEALVQELISRKIKPEQLVVLISHPAGQVLNANEIGIKPADFEMTGQLKNEKIQDFINRPFDLLISYYDVDKPLLLWCTAHSKAKFKAGFSSVKLNNNHFSLQVEIEKYKSYIDELFRYIEILKK